MRESIIKELITVMGTITVTLITCIFSYKKAKNQKTNLILKNHIFFKKIKSIKNDVNISFHLKNKGKEKIFKHIITEHLNIFSYVLEDFVHDIDSGVIKNPNDLCDRCINDFESILNKLQCFYFNGDYSKEDIEVLNIVMGKYVNWNEDLIRHNKENIYMICNSLFYPDVVTKASVILDSYLSVAINTINNGEKTLNNINGDLRGLTFKGVVI